MSYQKYITLPGLMIACTILILNFQNCSMVGSPQVTDSLTSLTSSSLSANPSFAEISQKILQPKCLACHTGGTYDFTSYTSLMATNVVTAGSLSNSVLYQDILTGKMPQGGMALSSSDIAAIGAWITSGALDSSTSSTGTAPQTVSNFTASGLTQTEINLYWTLPGGTVTLIEVERATNSAGPYSLIATLGGTATGFIDMGLSYTTTYYYKVRAGNSYGDSPYSTIASAMPSVPAPPPTPTPTPAPAPTATFSSIYTNIIQPRCVSCHGGAAGYTFTSYSGVMRAVTPNSTSSSKLYTATKSGSMPASGSALTAQQLQNIADWINAGALNN
jgi:mono/diheme cytochrome c family protein